MKDNHILQVMCVKSIFLSGIDFRISTLIPDVRDIEREEWRDEQGNDHDSDFRFDDENRNVGNHGERSKHTSSKDIGTCRIS